MIMKLSRNQMLDFTLIAKKGNAKTHAKWSPVATCVMRAKPVVELDQSKLNKLSTEHKQEFVGRCPRKVFSYNQAKRSVDIEDSDKCNLCTECVKYIGSLKDEYREHHVNWWDNVARIDERDNCFYFTVESTGALQPEDIVLRAFNVLRQKLQMLISSI